MARTFYDLLDEIREKGFKIEPFNKQTDSLFCIYYDNVLILDVDMYAFELIDEYYEGYEFLDKDLKHWLYTTIDDFVLPPKKQ